MGYSGSGGVHSAMPKRAAWMVFKGRIKKTGTGIPGALRPNCSLEFTGDGSFENRRDASVQGLTSRHDASALRKLLEADAKKKVSPTKKNY